MKYLFYFFVFLCLNVPSFALDPDPTSPLLKKSYSTQLLSDLSSRPSHQRSRSVGEVEDKIDDIPALKDLVDLEEEWGFNLALVSKRQMLVRKKNGNVDKEPATDILNLGTTYAMCPMLARLSLETQDHVITLSAEKEAHEKLIRDHRVLIKEHPADDGEKATNKSLLTQIEQYEDQLSVIEEKLKHILEGPLSQRDNLETVCSLVKALRLVKNKIVINFGKYGITFVHLEQIPRVSLWEQELHGFAKLARLPSASQLSTSRISRGLKSLEDIYGLPQANDNITEPSSRRRFATATIYTTSRVPEPAKIQSFLKYLEEIYGDSINGKGSLTGT